MGAGDAGGVFATDFADVGGGVDVVVWSIKKISDRLRRWMIGAREFNYWCGPLRH